MIRMGRVLNFYYFKPGIFAGRLIKMPVNTNILFQSIYLFESPSSFHNALYKNYNVLNFAATAITFKSSIPQVPTSLNSNSFSSRSSFMTVIPNGGKVNEIE